jgi:hypothetical protein
MPKKEKVNKKVIWSIFIAIIMVSSVFGVIFGSFAPSGNRVNYKGFSFYKSGEYWVAKINKENIYFFFLPSEVEDINISDAVITKLSNTKMFYLTYHPNQTIVKDIALAQFQLQRVLHHHLGIYVASALTTNSSNTIPVVTCENATAFVPVVEFRESNTTSINLDNNCVVIEVESTRDVFMMKDRLVYALLGIIK